MRTFHFSPLQQERLEYQPKLPLIFENKHLESYAGQDCIFLANDKNTITSLFKNTAQTKNIEFKPSSTPIETPVQKVGILFSGGPAAGGHNVVWGIFQYLTNLNPKNQVFGFKGGPIGLIKNKHFEITQELIQNYKNQGGFDLLGSGRDKIKSDSDFEACLMTCTTLELTGFVIVGGDDSNTNAAQLAEYLKSKGCKTNVIGVPKTIDGDLKGNGVEISFGHDTCTKVFSELIGNLATDAPSSLKYYSFVKLMGRDASHITLECALCTQPNLAFISEEIGAKKKSLKDVVDEIVEMVIARAKKGKYYGVVLIPEGIVGFIPEFNQLINELNDVLAKDPKMEREKIDSLLSTGSKTLLDFLPDDIAQELLGERDAHGNVQLSRVETEKLLSKLAEKELKKQKIAFAPLCHFFGYEGRCALPSNFDSDYCYTLGFTAGTLLSHGYTGMMAGVRNLTQEVSKWEIFGIPLPSLMTIEKRSGHSVPVIKKALVELESKSFKHFVQQRRKWIEEDCFLSPGPIQYLGKSCESRPSVLTLETN